MRKIVRAENKIDHFYFVEKFTSISIKIINFIPCSDYMVDIVKSNTPAINTTAHISNLIRKITRNNRQKCDIYKHFEIGAFKCSIHSQFGNGARCPKTEFTDT